MKQRKMILRLLLIAFLCPALALTSSSEDHEQCLQGKHLTIVMTPVSYPNETIKPFLDFKYIQMSISYLFTTRLCD